MNVLIGFFIALINAIAVAWAVYDERWPWVVVNGTCILVGLVIMTRH